MTLATLFVGSISNYGAVNDEDDLFPNPLGMIQKEEIKKSEVSEEKDAQEIKQDLIRMKMIELLFHKSKKLMFGLSSNCFMNLRLISKVHLTDIGGFGNVYKFRFALERQHHVVVAAPGDCFVFLINKGTGKSNSPSKVGARKGQWISRQYTPLVVRSKGYVDVIIKIYKDGAFTPLLDALPIGGSLRVMGPRYHKTLLNKRNHTGCYRRIGLICGGTGITPMFHLIDHYMSIKKMAETDPDKFQPNEIPEEIVLIHSNISENNVIGASYIDRLVQNSKGLLWACKVISNAEQTDATSKSETHYGRINSDLIIRMMPFARSQARASVKLEASPMDGSAVHMFVCGPRAFNNHMEHVLTQEVGMVSSDITLI
jgi:ferredoxin-NADP reductase